MENRRVYFMGLVGSILSTVLSYAVNASAGWAIVHFFCSWVYVIYWVCAKSIIIQQYVTPLIAPVTK